VSTALLVHFFDLTFYVDKSEFDVLWGFSDPLNNPLRKQAFLDMFKMVSSTRVDQDQNVIDIWAYNYPFWLIFATFSLSEDFQCPTPCPLLPSFVLVE